MIEEYGTQGTLDTETPSHPWAVRGIDPHIRYRLRVLAARRAITQGELVNPLLRTWLDAGAPNPDDLFHGIAPTTLCVGCGGEVTDDRYVFCSVNCITTVFPSHTETRGSGGETPSVVS